MKNLRLFKGINDEAKDVPSISPDSFRFHGTMKALFYRVLKLINPPPKKWMNDLEGTMLSSATSTRNISLTKSSSGERMC